MKLYTEAKPEINKQCTPLPEFERLNYYYGQNLGVAEFLAEQQYFLEKLRLHNRCLHGWGIVCGLEVDAVPEDADCISEHDLEREALEAKLDEIEKKIESLEKKLKESADEKEQETGEGVDEEKIKEELEMLKARREEIRRQLEKLPPCTPRDKKVSAKVLVNCGWALDCDGRELMLKHSQLLNLWQLLDRQQCRQAKSMFEQHSYIDINLILCYCEQPTYPSRPIVNDTCIDISRCVYGRTREGVKFKIEIEPEPVQQNCDSCCEPCEHECVILAHIRWHKNRPILAHDIDWSVRRMLSLYQTTTVAGVSWVHGEEYTADEVKNILGTKILGKKNGDTRTDGLEIVFSRPVYAETIKPGVIDVWRIHGGSSPSGEMTHIQGSFVDKPDSGLITSFKYQDDGEETLSHGDRVLIILRSSHILDECCKPVDGEHVGGMVPQLEKYQKAEKPETKNPGKQKEKSWQPKDDVIPPCARPPVHRLPWTSGNGIPGGTFESWFYINEETGVE